jgi:hypothetical protein
MVTVQVTEVRTATTGPMKMALSVLAKLALQEVTAEIKNGTTMHGPTTNQIIGGALRIVPKCGTMEVGLARGMICHAAQHADLLPGMNLFVRCLRAVQQVTIKPKSRLSRLLA